MISKHLNPNKCLTKVDLYDKQLDKIATIDDVDDLIEVLSKHASPAQATKLSRYLPEKINYKATFTSKHTLKKYLSIIAGVLNDEVEGMRLSRSAKKAVISKLTEGIENCAPGYLNRVYIIMGSLNQYESIDALLCAYRLQLVEKAFNTANSDEVHLHHRFHVVANSSGYGIPYKDVKDPYTGNLSDSQIEKRLKDVFDSDYTPGAIMTHFWEQASIYQLGYVGSKDDELGYDIGTFSGILELFRKIFNNPDLSIADCFIVDEETSAVRDIDWLNINSKLFNYFMVNHYFDLKGYQSQFVCHDRHKQTLSLSFPNGGVKSAVVMCVGQNGESYTGFLSAVKKELFSEVPGKLLVKLRDKVAERYQDATLDQLKELYQLDLISFDFLFPRLVAHTQTVESFVESAKGLSEEESRLLFDAVRSDFNYNISSVSDAVKFIKAVSSSTLKLLVDDERFRLAISSISSDHCSEFSYISFLSKLGKEKAGLVFDIISEDFFSKRMKHYEDIKRIIKLLPADKIALVCAAFNEKKQADVNTADFKRLIHYLDDSQKAAVYEAFKESLIGRVKTWRGLSNLLKYLPEEQCRDVLTRLDGRLTGIFKKSSDFHEFSHEVTLTKTRMVMDALGDHLPQMIKSVQGFTNVTCGLKKQDIARLLANEVVYNTVANSIESYSDAYEVFSKLSTSQRSVLFRKLKPKLADLTGCFNFTDFSNQLTAKECEVFYTLQGEKLAMKADRKGTLFDCCDILHPKQLSLFLMKLKEQNNPLLSDNSVVKSVVSRLDQRQRSSLSRRLTGLNPEERDVVANCYRRVYQAYLASLTSPTFFKPFKPHHELLSNINNLTNDTLIARIALGLGNKPDSLVEKIWHYALLHTNDYQNDAELQQSIAAWSREHSSFFHRSRYSNNAPNAEVPAQVRAALRA